jgi:hypothetical protein
MYILPENRKLRRQPLDNHHEKSESLLNHPSKHRIYWCQALLALVAIIAAGGYLRFSGLTNNGFRMCDEGYYFNPARMMKSGQEATPILYYYHGTVAWVRMGCRFLGTTPNAALIWAAINGLACIPLVFAFAQGLLSLRTSILTALAVSCNYYLVYYSRINLSNIYGVLFTLAALYPMSRYVHLLGKAISDDAGIQPPTSRRIHLHAAVAGLLTGLLFHVRVDSFVFLCGMSGLTLIAVAIKTNWQHWPKRLRAIGVDALIFILAAGISCAAFVVAYFPWFDWNQTCEWYLKNVPFLTGTARDWGPYLYIHLWRLSSIPFWGIALIGAGAELVRIRTLPFPRLWLLLCLVGSVLGFTVIGLPFPRGHIFFVLLMTIYWAVGIRFAATILTGKARWGLPGILVMLTLFGEMQLMRPMLRKQARYDKISEVMTRSPGNLIHNPNWPIVQSYCPNQMQTVLHLILPGNYDEDDLKLLLLQAPAAGYYYLLLDYYTTLFMDTRMLARMALTIPPVAVFFNDYGDDWHNFMDAFGREPGHSMFSDKLVLYDMRQIRHPIQSFPPYTTEEDMEKRFVAMLTERMSSNARLHLDKSPSPVGNK